MQIKKLHLINFRNYKNLELEFTNQTTIFLGSNGAGKSNILESVYLLSTSKSPRVDEEIEFIKKGEEAATVKGNIEQIEGLQSSLRKDELMVTMVGDGDIKRFAKRVSLNGVGKRVLDFVGVLPSVIFWPTDINMVTGSPSLRRWHLDLALAQSNQSYKKALTIYEQVVTNRNRVLKRINEGLGRIDELTYWTDELIREGKVVSGKRKEFFEFINDLQSPIGNFIFEYHPNELSYERLEQYKDREVAAMNTLIGPHRDDFKIVMLEGSPSNDGQPIASKTDSISTSLTSFQNDKGRDISKFGSRGEQRMATLAFKLAQLEYMSVVLERRPVLLLDDVFSELDANHRKIVAEISLRQQTIITTVELENIPQEFLDKSKLINMEDIKF